ncbi:MAG TPA: hypothetical protein VJU60_13080 [Thermoleophilaceae bacterium]|nr:hypothetical protein [Thermoleophilaceae bacterium]
MSERRPQDGGTKLSPQTLIIASLASLTAAIVTSTFWQRGTPITAAITPVIVAVASELYSRPARRITELRSRRFAQQQVPQRERVPSGAPPRRPEALRPPDDGELGPMRIYRTEQRSSPIRRVHIRAALITAAIAFVIALAVLTLPELIFGGSVAARGSRTTFFGGGTSHHTHKTPSNTQTAPTTTTPSSTAPTQTAPATTTPPAQTAPQTTAPSQTPAPSGATGTTGPGG